jgi:hypothetical protein
MKRTLILDSKGSDDDVKLIEWMGLWNLSIVPNSKGPTRVSFSLPSAEDGNRSGLRNFIFPSYLEFRTTVEVDENSDFFNLNAFLYYIFV